MLPLLVCALAVLQPAAPDAPPQHVVNYLRRCDEAKAANVRAKEREVKSLASAQRETTDSHSKHRAAEDELRRLRQQPAPLLPLNLPPAKGDVGTFDSAAVRGRDRGLVDVLEVIDGNSAIIRAWYLPDDRMLQAGAAAEGPTFVDLWLHGIDTSGLAAGTSARLPQVFHASGNRSFGTTCGQRSLSALEPVDIERFRGR